MDEASKKKVDAILLLAKSSFSGRRRRSLPTILACLAVVLVLSILLVRQWLPRPSSSQLVLAAYDQITLPDKRVSLGAQVEALEQSNDTVDLGKLPLYFQESNSPEFLGKVETSPDGMAILEKTFGPRRQSVEVLVRYPGEGQRRGTEERAHVYVWPADAALLVVDADQALANVDEPKFWTMNNLEIPPVPGAAAALQKLQTKYRVVYYSRRADRPTRYNKLSFWLQRAAPPTEQLPEGPLLSPAGTLSASSAADSPRELLRRLEDSFPGKVVGVVKRKEDAEFFQSTGLRTYLLGENEDAPKNIRTVKSWKALADQLSR